MRRNEFPIVKEYCKDKVVEEIEKIKTDIENLSKAYQTDYNTGEEYEYLDREEVLQILDEYIKENKQ